MVAFRWNENLTIHFFSNLAFVKYEQKLKLQPQCGIPLCKIRDMVSTFERIKPHATILIQIHGYIDTDYSCQCNDLISPISNLSFLNDIHWSWEKLWINPWTKSFIPEVLMKGSVLHWCLSLVVRTVANLKWKIEGFLLE